jgi:hypothetical protein
MRDLYGHYLYDSSIVLAQIFLESRFKNRIKKIQDDVSRLHVEYFITPSIVSECKKKVDYIGTFVAETVRRLNKALIFHKDPLRQFADVQLDETDLSFFMKYFAKAQASLAIKNAPRTEKESLEYIETWIVRQLEDELSRAQSISARQFFVRCVTEATTLHSNWTAELSKFVAKTALVKPDTSVVNHVLKCLAPIQNYSDKTNIAEAIEYLRNQKKTVFVALDYRDLVNNADLIEKTLGLKVADPLYALSILRGIP